MSTSDEVTFGQLIGSYRTLRAKLAQKALADLIGVSDVALRHWESDQSKPTAPNLQKLLEVFLDLGIFKAGKEEEEARALWKASRVNIVFAEVWTNALTNTRKQKPDKKSQVDAALAQPIKTTPSTEVALLGQKIGQIDQRPHASPSTQPETGQFDGNPSDSHIESAPHLVDANPKHLVDTSTKKEVSSPSSDDQSQGTMEKDLGLEGEDPMEKLRRDMLQQGIELVGVATAMPVMRQQDLITEVQHVLRQPSLIPGDKELKLLEQKILFYWQARNSVVLAPTDLILHVDEYMRAVTTLLNRSLLPSTRTRLCACLSQGMLLIGHNLDGMKQFQTARRSYQMAIEAAHETNHDVLQALAWYRNSRSWAYSDEPNRYEQAQESMLKACEFASLQSDLAVQCVTQLGLAEAYAYLKQKEACLEALKCAERLDGYGPSDWYFIHLIDSASLNGYRGACLQQLYDPDDADTHPLLEEAKQLLEAVLSQQNTGVLRRAFCVADMAQVYAREGQVESACDSAKQIIGIADTNASLRQSLLAVLAHLKPYADVQIVKDLNREMRVVLLAGQQ